MMLLPRPLNAFPKNFVFLAAALFVGQGGALAADGKFVNLERLERIVRESKGPDQVLAVTNPGDEGLIGEMLEGVKCNIFRADGRTNIISVPEVPPSGQLLGGMLAVEHALSHGFDRNENILGTFYCGKGTRAEPMTSARGGVKPAFEVPIRTNAAGTFEPLPSGAASLYTWTLYADYLKRSRFRGVPLKWGDEPQIGNAPLDTDPSLSRYDVIRFGAELTAKEITEYLANNKEFMLVDKRSGRVARQLHRRPKSELLEEIARSQRELDLPENAAQIMVHIGSPALSYRWHDRVRETFGDMEGQFLDYDGWVFDIATATPEQLLRETKVHPGLEGALEKHATLPLRVWSVTDSLGREARYGGNGFRIRAVNVGPYAHMYWGDMGTWDKVRETWVRLLHQSEMGRFARRLANLHNIQPDKHGNLLLNSHVPDDGSVKNSVLIGSQVNHAESPIESVVLFNSQLGKAHIGRESVVIESTGLDANIGERAISYYAVRPTLNIPREAVLVSVPEDPHHIERQVERKGLVHYVDSVHVAKDNKYKNKHSGNPTTFADLYQRSIQRETLPHEIRARISSEFRQPMKRAISRGQGRTEL